MALVTPEAQRYLAERLALLRQLRVSPGNPADAIRSTIAHVGGALEAFRLLGAVSEVEMADWLSRAIEAGGGERPSAPPAPVTKTINAATSLSATLRAVRLPGGPEPAAPPAPLPPARFLRLVPVSDGEVDFFGGRLRILGVELYDREAAILWRMAPLPDLELALPNESAALQRDTEGLPETDRHRLRMTRGNVFGLAQRFVVRDDLGNEYRNAGGGGGGGGDEATGRLVVRPAPPQEAAVFVVDALGHELRVPLGPT